MSNKFDGIPTDELSKEVSRRHEESMRIYREKREQQQIAQQELITEKFVNAFHPEHGRTSCDDKKLQNGWASMTNGRTSPRCARCALLEIARGEFDLLANDILLEINL